MSMEAIDPQINQFLSERHVFTLGTSADNQPYSANCFYVYRFPLFVFASAPDTRHAREMVRNPRVSIAVQDNVRDPALIKGVQALGTAASLDSDPYPSADAVALREHYLDVFPEARELGPVFWRVTIHYAKMTDNSVRFGFKRSWGTSDQ